MPLFEMIGCDPCSLKKEWQFIDTPKMPLRVPEIPSEPRYMVVGEMPGEQDDPYSGRAGKFLRSRIPQEFRDKLYWQNVVRCRPQRGRASTSNEQSCCRNFLINDIRAVKPHGVLALDDVALSAFVSGQRVAQLRGVVFPASVETEPFEGTSLLKDPFWVLSTYQPDFVIKGDRKQDDGTITNARDPVFSADLRKFFTQLPPTPPIVYRPPTQKQVLYPKSLEEALNLYARLEAPYGIDFETFKKKPYLRDARLLTCGLSDFKLTFALPLQWPGMLSTWGMEFFRIIMTERKKRWIAHNATMELPWIIYATGEANHQFDDSMAIARLHHHRVGILDLGSQTRIHLGVDIKKITNIKATDAPDYFMHRQAEFLYYNALDAWGSAGIQRIVPVKQTANYQRILDTTRSGVEMELRGLPIDLTQSSKLDTELTEKMAAIDDYGRTQFNEIKQFEDKASKTFSFSAPATVGEVLTKYCGIDLPKTRSGQYSTDESDLTPHLSEHPLIQVILDHREVQKLKSTYVTSILEGKLQGVDGLLHPAYKPMGTITGRGASSDPNIQNFPARKHREIRRQIIAPPGFILVSFDYGQLEARVLAMGAKDLVLRQRFIEGEDLHWKWLYRALDLYPSYMDRLAEKGGETEEKKILDAGRTIIKTDFVFASFYGSLARSIAQRTGIPLAICEQILAEFWADYKTTKKWILELFAQYQTTGTISTLTGRLRDEVLPGNEPINTPVQGTAADIVSEAQYAMAEYSIKEKNPHFHPRINVHDDLSFFFPDDSDLEQYIQVAAKKIVEPRFSFITTPLVTEAKVGYNWCDLEKIAKFEGAYFPL